MIVDDKSFQGWAIVELMGHNAIAGEVSEQTVAGVKMLRVDVPAGNGQDAFTKFFGGAAIYAITPTDEATASRAAWNLAVRPVNTWTVPDGRRELPPPTLEHDGPYEEAWDRIDDALEGGDDESGF
jgi:hypothetical protein